MLFLSWCEPKLFSKSVFNIVLNKITAEIPCPEAMNMVKTSRHDIGSDRSKLTFNDEFSLFPDPNKKNRLWGGMGVVKKAISGKDKVYAIKREKTKDDNPKNQDDFFSSCFG